MLVGKTPGGIYKLSREAILTAELPSRFTTRANWRGSLPRDILCTFCRQHHLSEPVFSTISLPFKALSESSDSCLKDVNSGTDGIECVNGASATASPQQSDSEMFKCDLKILSRHEDLLIKCSPGDCFKKQTDAIQNASLKLLSWLNKNFKNINVPFGELYETTGSDIQIYSRNLFREISTCQSLHNSQFNAIELQKLIESICASSSYTMPGNGVCSLKIEGPDSGVYPCNGSLPCISYSISLVVVGENIKEVIEVCNDFEFEVGVGAVISYVEEVVMQMSVGQSAYFTTNLLTYDFIFASAGYSTKMMSLLSSSKLLSPVNHSCTHMVKLLMFYIADSVSG